MKIQFLGAARQVTGSMYLCALDDGRFFLVDCGMDMTREKLRNVPPIDFPFNGEDIAFVLLTHAHTDHSANLPLLVDRGFEGSIYCTPATFALTEILLYDTARINAKKLKNTNRRRNFNPKDLYNKKMVAACLDQFVTHEPDQKIDLENGFFVEFMTCGHLLGAASLLLTLPDGKQGIFTGDLGSHDYPLLKNPRQFPQVGFIISESTYGKRYHEEQRKALDVFEEIIKETCVNIPGRLILPAFSIGRTQSMLFLLHQLQVLQRLPDIAVFTDSPLAQRSTYIYEDYHPYLSEEAQAFRINNGGLFNMPNLHYIEDFQSAEAIHSYHKPCIIISSSGMVKGGKIEEHIALNIENPYCTILFIGYCAPDTVGYNLLHGYRKTLTIRKKTVEVQAKVMATDVLSGHADFNGLMQMFFNQDRKRLQHIFLTHGEEEASLNLQDKLTDKGFKNVIVPEKEDWFEV